MVILRTNKTMGRAFSMANRKRGERPGLIRRILNRLQARADLVELIKAEEAWRDMKEPDSDRFRIEAARLRKKLRAKHFP
jgi:hypothetical protein